MTAVCNGVKTEAMARGKTFPAIAAADGVAKLNAAPANDDATADAAMTCVGFGSTTPLNEGMPVPSMSKRATSAERASKKFHVAWY
mmetsp:Transcript_10233/g.17962  ORF Transcript_10233/g.17962 Transcript_10233/m.17962 type:complete len:86 (-) Transcript_10233:858-1115(-)